MSCPPCTGRCNQGRNCPGSADAPPPALQWGRPGRGPALSAGEVRRTPHGARSPIRELLSRWLPSGDANRTPGAR